MDLTATKANTQVRQRSIPTTSFGRHTSSKHTCLKDSPNGTEIRVLTNCCQKASQVIETKRPEQNVRRHQEPNVVRAKSSREHDGTAG